jgi:hypothetical protein
MDLAELLMEMCVRRRLRPPQRCVAHRGSNFFSGVRGPLHGGVGSFHGGGMTQPEPTWLTNLGWCTVWRVQVAASTTEGTVPLGGVWCLTQSLLIVPLLQYVSVATVRNPL